MVGCRTSWFSTSACRNTTVSPLRAFFAEFPPTRNAGIIAFTALGEDYVRSKGLQAGFDGYCQKGNAPDVLVDLISKMVQVH